MDVFVRHLNRYHSTHVFYPTMVVIKSNRTIFVFMKCNAIIIQLVSRFLGQIWPPYSWGILRMHLCSHMHFVADVHELWSENKLSGL